MKLFVDKVSGYEGVETPDVTSTSTNQDERIQFDATAFMESINNLLSKCLLK